MKRNGRGDNMMGPRNKDRERQNPDLIRPPSTDHGNLPNLRWYELKSRIEFVECCKLIEPAGALRIHISASRREAGQGRRQYES